MKLSKSYINLVVKNLFKEHSEEEIINQILPAIQNELKKRNVRK